MGRQRNDSIMVGSSIALLQERFRQLDRVREKREEQLLLKLFTEPEKMVSPSPSMRFEASNMSSFQPNKIFPPLSPPEEDPLSLGLRSPSKVSDFRATTKGSLTNLWPTGGMVASPSSLTNGNSEVDTSLHL